MSTADKKRIPILLALVALLFLSAFLNFSRNSNNGAVPVISRRIPLASAGKQEALPSVAMLQSTPEEAADVQRNLFKFGDESRVEIPQPQESMEEDSEEQSEPSLPDVRYLGFYQEKKPSRVRLGAISNGGKIYVGGVGDVLANRYQILQIESASIVLRLLPENRIIRFGLGQNIPPVELRSWNTTQVPAVTGLHQN